MYVDYTIGKVDNTLVCDMLTCLINTYDCDCHCLNLPLVMKLI